MIRSLAVTACLSVALAACSTIPTPSASHGLGFAGTLDGARGALIAAGYACDDPLASEKPLNPSLRPAIASAYKALYQAFEITTCKHQGATQVDSIVSIYARRATGEPAGVQVLTPVPDSGITWAVLDPWVTPVLAQVLSPDARGVVAAAIQVHLGDDGVASAKSVEISPAIRLRMPAATKVMSGASIYVWAPDLEQASDDIDAAMTATPAP